MFTTYLFSSIECFFLKYLSWPRLLVLFQEAFLLFIGKHCWCHRLGTLRAHCYFVSVYLDIFWLQTLEILVCYSDMYQYTHQQFLIFLEQKSFSSTSSKILMLPIPLLIWLIFLFLFIYLFCILTIASPYTIHPSQYLTPFPPPPNPLPFVPSRKGQISYEYQ